MSSTSLVLLPGLDGTGKLLADFVAALPRTVDVHVVAYPTKRFLSYPELLPHVSDAIPRHSPFVLVAESFSTPLALMFAAEHPPTLVGLVMCAGFVSNPVRRWSWLVRAMAQPWLFRVSPPDFLLERFLIGAGAPAALKRTVRQALRLVKPEVLACRVRAVLDCDARRDLTRVSVPILYLQGTEDRLVQPVCFEEVRRLRPNTSLASIPAPHFVLQREPQKAAHIVMEFVRQSAMDA